MEYAVLAHHGAMKFAVDLRRVSVDRKITRGALLASGMPHAEWWAADWR